MSAMKITQEIKRKAIQIAAFGLTNTHLANLGRGRIYNGPWKQFCAPGLHCYSCPAAGLACPIGAMQAVSGSMKFSVSFYVLGFLLAVGVLLGRAVCGFLCPFGLGQELLHKLPTPKLRLPKWCRYVKYPILLLFVLLLPAVVSNAVGIGDPWFCKYICPSGTLFGAIPLLSADRALRGALGGLFAWKLLLLVVILVGSVLVIRFFCKLLCPLGAIYGFLNPLSLYRLQVDEEKCISCGKCARVCPMDVDPVKSPDSMECIRCGACREACPTGAIKIGLSFSPRPMKKKPCGDCGNCKSCTEKQ